MTIDEIVAENFANAAENGFSIEDWEPDEIVADMLDCGGVDEQEYDFDTILQAVKSYLQK